MLQTERHMKAHLFSGFFALTLSAATMAALSSGCSSDDGNGEGTGGAASGGAGTGGAASGGSASGGSASGGAGTGGGDAGQFPDDTSQAGIEAFLTAGSYKTWTGDAAPRSTEEVGSPHQVPLQAFFNDTTVATADDMVPGSMSVKEFYDDAGAQTGIAALLKTMDGTWIYYCQEEPAIGRCSGSVESSYPIYGQGTQTPCGFCHGNTAFAPIPGR